MLNVLGVDPGLDGGLAVICGNRCIHAIRMPIFKFNKDRRDHRVIERWRLVFWVKQAIKAYNLQYAVVEKVASSPQMGLASSFKFGMGYGEVLGVLTACGLVVHDVHPNEWKPRMQLSRDKSLSLARFEEIFSEKAVRDGPAEAALIAHYYQRELEASKKDVMK